MVGDPIWAVFILFMVIASNFKALVKIDRLAVAYGIFILFLLINAKYSPLIIDQDGSNIARAAIGIMIYSSIMTHPY